MSKAVVVPIPEVSAADRSWLKGLHEQLWKKNSSFPVKVELAGKDWRRLQKIIHTCQLLCEMGSGVYGGYIMSVYEHAPTPGMPPEFLISLSDEHLPRASALKSNSDAIWGEFSRFTHSDRNRELLAFYGMEAPKGRSSYEY